MQLGEARQLRERVRGVPCDHPGIEKEYDRGGHAGDYSCSICGKMFFSREEWAATKQEKGIESWRERRSWQRSTEEPPDRMK
jgi:hypothetical protein